MSTPVAARHWWNRPWASTVALLVVLMAMGAAVVMLANRAVSVLPEVSRDQLGEDNWSAPLGLHLAGGFQVARVPDCAAGAFTRMVLWSPDSEEFWEVQGPPTPLNSFVVGAAPEGFTTVTPFRDPPRGELLRLVAFRRDGGPVGIRYRSTDLRENRVVSLNPLSRFTIEGFQTAEVCSQSPDDTTTTTTGDEPGLGDTGPTGGTQGVPGLGASGGPGRSSTTIDDGTGPLEN